MPSSRHRGSTAVQEQTPARSDWLLVALESSPDGALTPVQMQKTLFLLKENCPKAVGSDFYNFRPYNYGPFDEQVYRDADRLSRDGLVRRQARDGVAWAEYALTDQGHQTASNVLGNAPKIATTYVRSVAEWARKLTFSQLVRAIYKQYPKYRANSVFQG